MRLLYTALLYVAAPFVLLRLLWKSRLQPEYRGRIDERFGFVPRVDGGIAVWVHAVSVGEALAALPLIEALIQRHGSGKIWVTTTTPTGSQRIAAALGDRVHHSYAPYDLPGAIARFLDRIRPQQVIVMETELWPNLFRRLHRLGIPLTIANARLSQRSFHGYSRVPAFARSTIGDCSAIAAQSAADAERFVRLGAPAQRVSLMGNLKFDLSVPEEQARAGKVLRAALGPRRPVWIAASTHEGEETAAITAHQALLRIEPNAVLILVPRHPQRFDAVWRLLEASGLAIDRRSRLRDSLDQVQVLLGDSMGEMFRYLAAGDLVFVGGSLVDIGGHNVLEPAALGLPVVFGPYMHNFENARALLLEHRAAIEVADVSVLSDALVNLLRDAPRRAEMGAAGAAAVAANRGALGRLLAVIDAQAAMPSSA